MDILRRAFLETSVFQREWKHAGLSDADVRSLQIHLLDNPDAGDVIQHTGGLRKVRVGIPSKGRGKRGGGRVIYKDFPNLGWIVLVYFYAKDAAPDLTPAQRKTLRDLVDELESVVSRFVRRGGTR